MKRLSILSVVIFIFLTVKTSLLSAALLDELNYIDERNDIHIYANIEKSLNFFNKNGINNKDLNEIMFSDEDNEADRIAKAFKLNIEDVEEVLLSAYSKEIENKNGLIIFMSVKKGKGVIPDELKIKKLKIDNIEFYDLGDNIFFTKYENLYIVGTKNFIESYLDKKKKKAKNNSKIVETVIKNSKDKSFYFRLDITEHLKNLMEQGFKQGAMFVRGINDNVFLKTLLNLRSLYYSIDSGKNITFNCGLEGTDAIDGERLLMLTHFTIVGTSFVLTFADLIAAKNSNLPVDEVARNYELLSQMQNVIGRIKTKQVDNTVTVSFSMTDKETETIVAAIKRAIEEEKKDIADRREKKKISIFTEAILENDSAKIDELLKQKFNIDQKDLKGNTILSTAAYMGNTKVAIFAINRGADIKLKTDEGMAPIHYAAKGGSSEMVKLLLQKGADINERSDNDMTALHYNASQGNVEITKILIKSGADINALSMDGTAPIHLAAAEGYIDVIKVLVEKGANVELEDSNQMRAVDIAAKNDRQAVVDFFKEKYNLEPRESSYYEENSSDFNNDDSDSGDNNQGEDDSGSSEYGEYNY